MWKTVKQGETLYVTNKTANSALPLTPFPPIGRSIFDCQAKRKIVKKEDHENIKRTILMML
ncbi:MAG: hypothetical protein K6T88_00340 [Bacillus sp. (in: Bacteria)]|nr:hypothetical protein [Bacillus sp. (in: firmicutes)]